MQQPCLQNLIVPLKSPDASVPFGSEISAVTQCWWPFNTLIRRPLRHSESDLSRDATTRVPSSILQQNQTMVHGFNSNNIVCMRFPRKLQYILMSTPGGKRS